MIDLMRLTLLVVLLFTLTSCSSTPEPQPAVGTARITYTKGVPGGVLIQTVKITATVAAIDPAKRQATFQGIDGKKFTVKIGKEVANADQIQVGDKVSAIITQKVRISLDDRAPAASDTKSGASTAETMQMSARISAIDAVKRTATLRFDDGNTETVSVRDDVEFNRHKVGDQVTFRITEMIASRVERMQ